jgi:hypothetical protein
LSTRRVWGWRAGPFAWLLLRHRVPYAVIGGAAIGYYSCGARRAADLDVVVAPGPDAAGRAFAALEELVENVGVSDGPEQFSATMIAAAADLRFTTSHGRLHLTGSAPGLDRARVVSSRRWVIIDRAPLALCAFSELLEQKRINPREQDRRDVMLLEHLFRPNSD